MQTWCVRLPFALRLAITLRPAYHSPLPPLQVASDGAWSLPLTPFSCSSDGAWGSSIAAAQASASAPDRSLQGCVCVELLAWMLQPLHCSGSAEPQVSLSKEGGRLACPKCASKLGRWTWGSSSWPGGGSAVWSALCVTFALQRSKLR